MPERKTNDILRQADECRRIQEADRVMWMGIRMGLIGVVRSLGAVLKAIERRHGPDDRQAA